MTSFNWPPNEGVVRIRGAGPIYISGSQSLPVINFNPADLFPSNASLLATDGSGNPFQSPVGVVTTYSTVRSAAVMLTSGVGDNVTSSPQVLGPGTWLVRGGVGFKSAAMTIITSLSAAFSTTTGVVPAGDTTMVPDANGQITVLQSGMGYVTGSDDIGITIPPVTVTVAPATTVTLYLTAQGSFSASSLDAYGFFSAERIS